MASRVVEGSDTRERLPFEKLDQTARFCVAGNKRRAVLTAFHQIFVAFKNQLKTRFRQLDIWMTTYVVEVI